MKKNFCTTMRRTEKDGKDDDDDDDDKDTNNDNEMKWKKNCDRFAAVNQVRSNNVHKFYYRHILRIIGVRISLARALRSLSSVFC